MQKVSPSSLIIHSPEIATGHRVNHHPWHNQSGSKERVCGKGGRMLVMLEVTLVTVKFVLAKVAVDYIPCS